MIQNGMAMSTLIKMENVDSLSEMEDIVQQAEDELMQRSQQAAQAEQQAEAQKAQLESQDKQADLEFKYYKTDADNVSDEKIALINSETSLLGSTSVDEAPSIQAEAPSGETLSSRSIETFQKNQLDREKLNIEKQKLQLQRETNKVALENKVVGEK